IARTISKNLPMCLIANERMLIRSVTDDHHFSRQHCFKADSRLSWTHWKQSVLMRINRAFEMNFSAVILAGGKSSRMGRDKALLEIDGQPLLSRQIGLAR